MPSGRQQITARFDAETTGLKVSIGCIEDIRFEALYR
jgi:hypothetical protein